MPNEILLPSTDRYGNHRNNCVCGGCQTHQLRQILSEPVTENDLRDFYFRRLRREQDENLNRTFRVTIKRVVHGKAFYDLCMHNSPYEYFACYIKNEVRYSHMGEEEVKKFIKEIRMVRKVFRDWNDIVTNLTDDRMINIDVRKLSINQLYRARNLSWCIDYNEINRTPGRQDPENPSYSEEKYISILQFVHSIGILNDAEYDPVIASCIGRRLQNDLTTMCSVYREDNG